MSLLQGHGFLSKKKTPGLLGPGGFGEGLSGRDALRQLLSDGNTAAWYQPGIGVTGTLNASLWANWVNGTAGTAADLAQDTSVNQPIYLSHFGTNYGWFGSLGGNYFSTLDSAAISITGDIDIRVDAALDSWVATNGLCGKDGAGVNRSWHIRTQATTGKLVFIYFTNGTTAKTATSSVGTGFSAASRNWVRVTLATVSGDVKFYTSSDGVSWSQLGTTQSTTAGAIFDSTAALIIGDTYFPAGDYPAGGKVYRCQIYNGINGTLASDYNAADWPETTTNGATQVSSTTGETYTLTNTGATPAQIVGSPQLLFNSAAPSLMAATFTSNQPVTDYIVVKRITGINGGRMIEGVTLDSMEMLWVDTTPEYNLYAGTTYAPGTINSATNTYAILGAQWNGASSLMFNGTTTSTPGNAGTQDAGGIVLGAHPSGTSAGNWQVKEYIRRHAADGATTQLVIIQLLAKLHGIAL